jgi:hypothetical protein
MKLSLQQIHRIIETSEIDDNTKNSIIQNINQYVRENQNQGVDEALPKPEKYPVTILVGAQEVLDAVNSDQLYAYTVMVAETANHNETINELTKTSVSYNTEKKRKKSKIHRFTDCFEKLKSSNLEDNPLKILTKEPAIIIKTANFSISQQNDAQG